MKQDRYLKKSPIELIEESSNIFRSLPLQTLLLYYTGTLPFILGLFYFWSDMSRNAYAYQYCAAAALALSILFIWMKCWHTVFALHVKTHIGRYEPEEWSFLRICRMAAAQSIIQPIGLFLLPISLFAFGWTYAFFQNLAAVDFTKPLKVSTTIRSYCKLASLWPMQNHMLLSIFVFFGFFVFLNLGMAILILPHILQKLFGIHTVFALSGLSILNTTFFAITGGITYLCIDPFIKIAYTLRCFYGESLASGDDLRADLKTHRLSKKLIVAIFLFCLLFSSMKPISAQESDISTPYNSFSVSPQALDVSIQEVLNRPEFSWRLPREKASKKESTLFNPFKALFQWLKPHLVKLKNTIKKTVKKILDWLKQFFPEVDTKQEPTNLDWMTQPQVLLFVLLCAVACILTIYLRRLWSRKKVPVDDQPIAHVAVSPDLTDDGVNAADLPVDRWLKLAKELTQKGSFRLALRAFYLAILAYLAQQEYLSIAKYKSNRDYVKELQRRGHEKKDIIDLFSTTVLFFDRAWYGMKDVTQNDVHLFSSNFKRMVAFAEHQ